MSQSKIIISIFGVLIIAGGGAFLLATRSSSSGQTQTPINTTQTTTDKKISFTEFVKRGGAYTCEVHQGVGGMNTTGTVHLHDGLIRGEYVSEMQGMKMDSNVVVRDGYTYTWSSMMPSRGYKVKIVSPESSPDTTAGTSGSYSFNTEQIGDYNCEPWTADDSIFTLPKETTFIDAK